jgi:adenine-specific DNA-methyltransferase
MLFSRLTLMKELLSETACIYVHIDWHFGHYVKLLMDDLFGRDNFRNEIQCKRVRKNVQEYETSKRLNVDLDVVLLYSKTELHRLTQPRSKAIFGERWHAFDAPDLRTGMDYEIFGLKPPPGRHWMWEKEKAQIAVIQGVLRPNPRTGRPEYRVMSEKPIVGTLWDDISAYSFKHGFETEKSEELLSRILETSCKEGHLVADFFCGSGTTLAVAEKLGRRWIGCDLSRWAIHTTCKRLLGIENCKPFEVLNLGKYERKYWQGVTNFGLPISDFGLKDKSKLKEQELRVYEYLAFILKLYGAQPLSGMQHLHGKKGKAMIHVGAVDAPLTIDEVNACIAECLALKQTELHVLGWEWEMGLANLMVEEAKRQGVKLLLLNIPREVMKQQAVDKGDIRFFEVAHLEVEIEKIQNRKSKIRSGWR